MEEESFDNPEIAAVLNKYFIAIKVDRESRPDIVSVYMEAVMLLTGRGGWPTSNFLTPEGKTFYGASYIPPEPFKTGSFGNNYIDNYRLSFSNRSHNHPNSVRHRIMTDY